MIVDDQHKDPASGIDPRYDPQFQRGYRPQTGDRPRTSLRAAPSPSVAPEQPGRGSAGSAAVDRTAVDRTAADRSAAADRPAEAAALSIAPVAPPRERADVVGPEAGGAEAVGADIVRADLAVAPAASILDRIELSPKRNPLMLALWVVGGGFVVLGIVLYSVSVSLSYAGPTPSTDVGALVLSQLGWMLAGPLITIGLATIVALLFLTALAGRRRRPAEYSGGVDARDGDR